MIFKNDECDAGNTQTGTEPQPVERAELIEKLFQSFDKAPDMKIDALWADESESRIDAYDAGQIATDSAKAVFERISKR